MREEMDSLREIFLLYRHELGYGLIACLVAVLRHWQKGDPFREIAVNGLLCGIVAFGVQDILEVFGIGSSAGSYVASVFIGYIGVEAILTNLPIKLPMRRKGGDDV